MKTPGHPDAATAMRYQHPGLEQIRKAAEERNREQAEMLARETQTSYVALIFPSTRETLIKSSLSTASIDKVVPA
jgi:hypothetical protein